MKSSARTTPAPDNTRQLGSAKLLIALCIVIVLLGGAFAAWSKFATLSAFPPTLKLSVAKDGAGYALTVHIWNRSGQSATDMVFDKALLGGVRSTESIPLHVEAIGPLQHRDITLHFANSPKLAGSTAPLDISFFLGAGQQRLGMEQFSEVRLK